MARTPTEPARVTSPHAGRAVFRPPTWAPAAIAERTSRGLPNNLHAPPGYHHEMRWVVWVALVGGCGGSSSPSGDDTPPADGASTAAVHWETSRVRLEADSLHILAAGMDFDAVGIDAEIDGDPGNDRECTLEVEWVQGTIPMRTFIYLDSDGIDWWSTEIRTYDGSQAGDWIEYPGERFRTPIGSAFSGDLDLVGATGELHVKNLRLQSLLQLTECNQNGDPAVLDVPERTVVIEPGLGYGAVVHLRNADCTMRTDQSDVTYAWSIADPTIANITPSTSCDNGVQAPCPANRADFERKVAGHTTVSTEVRTVADNTLVASGQIDLTVLP